MDRFGLGIGTAQPACTIWWESVVVAPANRRSPTTRPAYASEVGFSSTTLRPGGRNAAAWRPAVRSTSTGGLAEFQGVDATQLHQHPRDDQIGRRPDVDPNRYGIPVDLADHLGRVAGDREESEQSQPAVMWGNPPDAGFS